MSDNGQISIREIEISLSCAKITLAIHKPRKSEHFHPYKRAFTGNLPTKCLRKLKRYKKNYLDYMQ